MKRLFSILFGLTAAALAGGALLGVEVAAFTALDTTDVLTTAEAFGTGAAGGAIAIVIFAVGLVVVGLPMFFIMSRLRKLNAVTSALSGAVAATLAIMAFLFAAEVTDNSILLGLFLMPPGALAGWLLWRLGFKAAGAQDAVVNP